MNGIELETLTVHQIHQASELTTTPAAKHKFNYFKEKKHGTEELKQKKKRKRHRPNDCCAGASPAPTTVQCDTMESSATTDRVISKHKFNYFKEKKHGTEELDPRDDTQGPMVQDVPSLSSTAGTAGDVINHGVADSMPAPAGHSGEY